MNSQMKQKTINLLTICIKAGKVVKGYDTVKENAYAGKVYCVLTACDASAKTVKEAAYICNECRIKLYATELSKSELEWLCGKPTAVIGICDGGFAKAFGKFLDISQ